MMSGNNLYGALRKEAQNIYENVEKIKISPFAQVYTVNREAHAKSRQHGENKEPETGNYGGVFYSNKFRTNHEIFLHEIGFHGPLEVSQAKYNVQVELFQPNTSLKEIYSLNNPNQRIFKKEWRNVIGKHNKIFYVPITDANQSPILIQANVWYSIQFKLEGEPTERCKATLFSVSVPVSHNDGSIKSVNFSFNRGSKQMPELRFTL